MNKIYKVVWSKVKNCYVVVSEIAKNVITGGVKSAKVGKAPLASGMALGALMAFVITGSAMAAEVNINESSNTAGLRGLSYTGAQDLDFTEYTSINVVNTGTRGATGVNLENKSNAILSEITINANSQSANGFGFRLMSGSEKNGSVITYSGNTVLVNGDATITASGGDYAQGVYSEYSDVTFEKEVTITATSTGDYAYAVRMLGDVDKETTKYTDSKITFKGATTRLTAKSEKGEAVGIMNSGANVGGAEFTGSNVYIDAEGATGAIGVLAQYNAATVTSSANTSIDVKSKSNGKSYGILAQEYAGSSGVVDFEGSVIVDAEGNSAYSVEAIEGSSVSLGSAGKTVSITATSQDDKAAGVLADDSIVAINGNSTISATSNSGASAYGVRANAGSEVTLDSANVTVVSEDGNGFGFILKGKTEEVDGVKHTSGASINVTGATTINVTGGNDSQGVYGEYSQVTFGDNVTINAIGASDYAYAVRMLGDRDSATQKFSENKIVFDGAVTNLKAESANIAHGLMISGCNNSGAEFNGGQVNIEADGDNLAYGLLSQYGANTVASSKDSSVKITAKSEKGTAYGIYSTLYAGNKAGTVDLKGDVTVKAVGNSAYGVEALNGAGVSLGSADKVVSITANGAGTDGEAIAVFAKNAKSEVDITAKTLTVNATSKNANKPGSSLQAKDGGIVNVNADVANITGMIFAKGNGSIVNVEATEGSINGNVVAEDGSSIVVTLKSNGASFTGATNVTKAEKGVTLNLQKGATWYVTDDSTVSSVIGDNFNITRADSVNDEEKVTVTLDGSHADSIKDEYKSTISTITGVNLVLHEDEGLKGNQTIISDSDVILHSQGNGINVENGKNVSIQAAKFTLNNNTGFAILADTGSVVNVNASNAIINGNVFVNSEKSKVNFAGSKILNITNNVDETSYGILVETSEEETNYDSSKSAGVELGKAKVVLKVSETSNDTLNVVEVNDENNDENGEEDRRACAIRAAGNSFVNGSGFVDATVTGGDWAAGIEATHFANVTLGSAKIQVADNGNVGSEAYGIHVTTKGSVNLNGNLEAKVSGGEWVSAVEAYNGSSVSLGNGKENSNIVLTATANSKTVSEPDNAGWGVRAHGIFACGQTDYVYEEDGEIDEVPYGESIISVNASQLTVSASSDYGKAYGIYADDTGIVKANGAASVTAEGYSAYGIESVKCSNVELGSEGKTVSITATGNGTTKEAEAIAVSAIGLNSNVDITAGALTINATSANAQQPGSSLQAKDGGVIDVTANNAFIDGVIYAGNNNKYQGTDKSQVNMTAVQNITINGSNSAPVIQADKGGSVLVGTAGTKANIIGDVYVNNGGGVRVILGTGDSNFTGSTGVGSNDGAIVFKLYDGATWNVTENSNISKLSGNNFNVVAAEGAENIKVTIDGDNHNKADIYEDVYNKEDLPSSNVSIGNLVDVDLAIIDTEGGGLEACGQGAKTIINSNSNVEGIFGEVGVEVEGAGVASITGKNVTFNTGEDTVLVNDDNELNGNGTVSYKGMTIINATGNVSLTSTNGNALNNNSTQGSKIKVAGTNVNLVSSSGAAIAVGHIQGETSYNGIVNIGDENTKTVTITGVTGDLHEIRDEQGNLINYNEDNRAIIYSKGTVNITATDKLEINDTTINKKAIAACGGANVIVDGGKQTIINGEINADGHGYAVQDDGNIEHQDNYVADNINISIKGVEIIIDADVEASESVFARGDSSGIDNAVITVGDEKTKKVSIGCADSGLVASNGGSKIEVNSDTLIVYANGEIDDSAVGISAENSGNANNKLASIDINANNTEIMVEDEQEAYGVVAYGKADVNVVGNIVSTTSSVNGLAYGIFASDDGTVIANGNIDITATGYSAYGLEVLNGSTVELGNKDANVTFDITAIGTDKAEAQAISAEGGSQVTVNANKLSVTTSAESGVTGSVQARDNDSVIAVNATDVSLNGDMFAGEGARVAVNTDKFAVVGNVGSEGVIDIITGDVAYGSNTKFYTEGNGVINLAGGNVTGTLNIAKGNVSLTGAAFEAQELNKAITGEGKLVVDSSGVLKTTADQVFTVAGKDTVTTDKEVLDKNSITDVATNKVTFKAGSVSLSDDYSYDYLTSITDVIGTHKYNGTDNSATKIVMTGDLISKVNPDDVVPEEDKKLDVDDASNLGSNVELDKVTVEAENNLLIGAIVPEDGSVKVSAGDGSHIAVEDSVKNGFSANQLDLGEGSDGVVITGGQEIVLGGSQNYTSDGTSHEIVTVGGEPKEDLVIVVGTEDKIGDAKDNNGKLKIGNSVAKGNDKFQLTGKAVVNKDSELHAKGETTITKGVELKDGGKVHVDKDGHLKANIKAKGNDNVITGKVTGNLEVDATHPSTVIHLGNDKKAGKMNAEHSKLKGGTLFLDPAYAKGIDEGSAFALGNATVLDGAYIAGQNSTISFGVNSTDVAEEVFAKTGLTFGSGTDSNGNTVNADVNAVIYIDGTVAVTSGSITADGALTGATTVAAGTVNLANNSLLMVDAEDVKGNTAAITGATNVIIANNAKVYIDDAKKGEEYQIIENNDNKLNVANIITNNRLLTFTKDDVSGKFEAEVAKVSEVYGNDVIIDNVIDEALAKDEASSDIFNSAADGKYNNNTDKQVDALNSIGAMNELAGVTHTTYAVSNILTDAVADHMSLANAKELDKDIWAHYVHTKEDVDGLERAGKYSAQYNGIVVGADLYKEGKATVGAALTYVDGNINGSTLAARTENDAKYYGASIYGSVENKDTTVIADVSYLHGEHDITQRNSGNVITGKPESDAFSVGVRVEKAVKAGIGKLVPYAGARYMHLGTGNYANSIGLAYDTEDAELFLLPVGLKYSSEVKNTNGWTVRPVVELGYVWAFGDIDTNQTVSLNGASNGFGYDVTDNGSYVGRFVLEAERENISYALGYEYQKGDDVKADKWMVNVNWKF